MKTQLTALFLSLALIVGLGIGLNQSLAAPDGQPAASSPQEKVIRVIEHPGYFETLDGVFQIKPGNYTFEVTNRSGKDAGFVVAREGQDPAVLMVANGKTGRLKLELKAGSYSYSCPIIPTPNYPLLVK